MNHIPTPAIAFAITLAIAPIPSAIAQQVPSTTLTDVIQRGDGVINLLKDVSGDSLSKYFNQNGGFLMLGADVNENQSGNETRDSLGVAIKQVQLSISTTNGDFTFGDFFTSTSALLREAGNTTAKEYHTLFGQAGSSTLTSSTTSFDLSRYDDVMWIENINFTGDILSASLRITLLQTPSQGANAAESFFDFSGGFEEFALLSAADAVLLESANLGTATLDPTVSFSTTTTVTQSLATNASVSTTTPPAVTVPAAPAPPLMVLVAMAGIVLLRLKGGNRNAKD